MTLALRIRGRAHERGGGLPLLCRCECVVEAVAISTEVPSDRTRFPHGTQRSTTCVTTSRPCSDPHWSPRRPVQLLAIDLGHHGGGRRAGLRRLVRTHGP